MTSKGAAYHSVEDGGRLVPEQDVLYRHEVVVAGSERDTLGALVAEVVELRRGELHPLLHNEVKEPVLKYDGEWTGSGSKPRQ